MSSNQRDCLLKRKSRSFNTDFGRKLFAESVVEVDDPSNDFEEGATFLNLVWFC